MKLFNTNHVVASFLSLRFSSPQKLIDMTIKFENQIEMQQHVPHKSNTYPSPILNFIVPKCIKDTKQEKSSTIYSLLELNTKMQVELLVQKKIKNN